MLDGVTAEDYFKAVVFKRQVLSMGNDKVGYSMWLQEFPLLLVSFLAVPALNKTVNVYIDRWLATATKI